MKKIDTVDQSFAEVTAELLDDQVKRFALQKNEQRFLKKSCISMPTKGWIVIKFVACFGRKEPDASTKSHDCLLYVNE